MPRAREESDLEANPDAHADQEAVAREIVLKQLASQARTRSELARVLVRRGVPTETAEAVLDRMVEVGLVDDAAFAQGWVRSRQQRRHLSARALKAELNRKGIEPELVTEALSEVEPEDEETAARALVAKKSRTMQGLEPHVRYRRLAGALARKGFGSDVCRRVLAEARDTGDEG